MSLTVNQASASSSAPPRKEVEVDPSMAADMISANLAPGAMAEPARQILLAAGKKDMAEFEAAVRLFEARVMQDMNLAAYGGRWLAGVARARVPGLASMIRLEALLGELRGGGDALSVWVAQCWVETAGQTKLVPMAEALIAAWREVHTEHAIKFACALATSLSVVETTVAAKLMATVESTTKLPPAVEAMVEDAACWVDVGRVLSKLTPASQCLLEERLANNGRRWEWTSPGASQALNELKVHLTGPSRAATLFQTIIWENVWPTIEKGWIPEENNRPTTVSVTQIPRPKEEPVRLLVLVTLLLGMTLVYNAVNSQRMGRPLTSVIEMKRPSQGIPFGTNVMRRGVS